MSRPDPKHPFALRPGDPVSVIAPSSPPDRPSFERGLAVLASRYHPIFDASLLDADRYLAGPDVRRRRELVSALASPETRAVFCARGGYGAMRLLSGLALPPLQKPFVGFSDVTALHAAFQVDGRISLHGPGVTQLASLDPSHAKDLFDLLENPSARPVLAGAPLVEGIAEGPVLGGNLSVFTRLIGTPHLPDLTGAILVLEDVGERPYRLDRMWQHLVLAGALDRAAGIALGAFVDCLEKDAAWGPNDVLSDLARARGLPCVTGLPVGHGDVNRPFPLGARARLDGAAGTLTFLEGAVR